jgi:beta-lactam-binding protein with PASTA domain
MAAKLYRSCWSVGMTIGNAKAVDIFAEKNKKIVEIQAKSIYKKKSIGLPMMHDKIRKKCFYIFVNINADSMEMPDYFILTSSEAKKKVKQYETRGIIRLSTIYLTKFKNN